MENCVSCLSSIPRERSTKHAAGLLTYCSFVQPSHLIGSDLDSEQTILQITAAGLCQNLTGFPKTECGCKGTTKNAHTQVMRVFFYKKIRAVKKTSPREEACEILCMRDCYGRTARIVKPKHLKSANT